MQQLKSVLSDEITRKLGITGRNSNLVEQLKNLAIAPLDRKLKIVVAPSNYTYRSEEPEVFVFVGYGSVNVT